MRAFAPALLSALLFAQVGCAANTLTEIKRNGASISLVLEIEVQSDPNYINVEEHEPQNQPIYVEVLIQDELEHTSTQKILLTAGDKTSPSPKSKILSPVEERTKDTDVATENRQNGTVQRSEESPAQTRIEHIGTQKQLQVTDDTRPSTLLETKHTEAIQNRTESTDVQTERRQGSNATGSQKALAQNETDHTATQQQVPAAGDGAKTLLETKPFDAPQERTGGTEAQTQVKRSGNLQRSEEALARNDTENTAKQKQLQDSSAILQTKPIAAAQERNEGSDNQSERRQGSNVTRGEEALAQNETEHTETQKQVLATGSRSNTLLETKPLDVPQEQPKDIDSQTERRLGVPRSEAALAQDETEHTKRQNEVLAADDRSNTLLKTKSLDIPQEQLNDIDSPAERILGGGVPRSEASLAQNETEHTKTQKEVLATAERSNTLLETKPLDVPQERSEDVDSQTERRQDGDAPRNEGALAQNESDHTTQKQVTSLGDERTSAFLETKPFEAAQNRTEVSDVQIEKRRVGEARGNEVLASSFDNGSGATQVETARDIHHVLKDSKGTESSRNSSQREATESWKGTVTSQGSDWSTTTESVRHIVLEERHLVVDERQMTRGVSEASAAREANEVSREPAKDLQEESEVTNGSKANGPKREKVISMLSEAKVRRANRERNDVLKDAVETTQVAARPTVMSLQQEDVQRKAVTTTEGAGESRPSQLERNGASRNANDRAGGADRDVVKFTEDFTSGRGLKTSTTGRSLMSQDAGEIEVDSSLENPNKLTTTIVDERRVLLQTDATTVRGGDYVQKAIGIRTQSIVPATGADDEGSGWESDLYVPDF